MSLETYQRLGVGAKPADTSTVTDTADSDAVRQVKRRGIKDVTVIKTSTLFGSEEEVGPTSEYLQPAPKKTEQAQRKFDGFSVLIRRIIQRHGDRDLLERTELFIQSPTLCDIFRGIVVDTHSSFDITSTPIVIPAPFYELFYRREEIEQYANDNKNSDEQRAEIKLLRDFFRNDKLTLDNISHYESMIKQGKISVTTVWTLFPPNELLFLDTDGTSECWLCRDVAQDPKDPTIWWVSGVQLGFDGRKLGLTTRRCPISFAGKVDGIMNISELPIVPKRYFDRAASVSADIIKRGQIFRDIMGCDLDGYAYRHYQGPVWGGNGVGTPPSKTVCLLTREVMLTCLRWREILEC